MDNLVEHRVRLSHLGYSSLVLVRTLVTLNYRIIAESLIACLAKVVTRGLVVLAIDFGSAAGGSKYLDDSSSSTDMPL